MEPLSTESLKQPWITHASVEAANLLLRRAGFKPRWIVELGSGFDSVGQSISLPASISFSELPGFSTPTTPGHSGVVRFCRGTNGDAFIFCGRSHPYEGIPMHAAENVIQIASITDAEGVILCSACGGIEQYASIGDLLIFDDAIHFPPWLPLDYREQTGINMQELFPSPKRCFDRELQRAVRDAAVQAGVLSGCGTAAIVLGPCYETPAEIEALRRLGATAVTMSCGQSLRHAVRVSIPAVIIGGVTNIAGRGRRDAKLSHEIVLSEAAASIAPKTASLFKALIGLD